jgi:hypothetical protein
MGVCGTWRTVHGRRDSRAQRRISKGFVIEEDTAGRLFSGELTLKFAQSVLLVSGTTNKVACPFNPSPLIHP